MKKFEHVNANSIDEAVSVLGGGNAVLIAGGTDLLCVLKDEILPTYPGTVVNLKTISGLSYIKEESGVLKIGALTTLNQIVENSIVQSKYSALASAADRVGSPQLRVTGTIGGNLCQATRCWFYRASRNYYYCLRKGGTLCFAVTGDNRYNSIFGAGGCFASCPSDTAIALTALDAKVVTNKRVLDIDKLFEAMGTSLAQDEIITEIQVPTPQAGTKQKFIKFSIRKQIDFAVVSVATLTTSSGGNVTDSRIVLGGVSPRPFRAVDAEDEIKGKAITETSATAAGNASVKSATALPRNKYKVPIAKSLVKNALLA